ncbi:MAG: hypothetical protein NTY20_02670 [Candidatus Aenigmarchaeota archaeon]|nr:hypothetical protein [Candidatus Aenigmarchaeota archaeon]
MKEKMLEDLGLSKNEIKVYLTLLRLGSAPVGKITEGSGVHRRNVYDAVERLIKRSMIGYVTKDKVKHFEIANPNQLLDMVNEEKNLVERKTAGIKSVLPEMLLTYNSRKEREDVNIYRGKKGIVTILNDIINTGKENLVLGAKVPKKLLPLVENYHRKRLQAKIPLKMIFNRMDLERGRSLAKKPHTEVRFMPNSYDSPVTVNIYGDKVGLLIWSEAAPLGILIKNYNAYVGFREFFRMIWAAAEKA